MPRCHDEPFHTALVEAMAEELDLFDRGPGRAGGGEELGGLRALNFYHRRSAIQASTAVLANLN